MNEFIQKQCYLIETSKGLFEIHIKSTEVLVPFHPDATYINDNRLFVILYNYIETKEWKLPLYFNYRDITYKISFELLVDYT